jgi:hypothetical protein
MMFTIASSSIHILFMRTVCQHPNILPSRNLYISTESGNVIPFWVQYVIVPVIMAAIGTATYFWSRQQDWHRKRKFESLILRELEEVGPPPVKKWNKDMKLSEGMKGEFVHQKIFEKHVENRDFILSLDPSLVYFVNQLWNTIITDDRDQWLYYLKAISEYPDVPLTFKVYMHIKRNRNRFNLVKAYLDHMKKNKIIPKYDKKGKIKKAHDEWYMRIKGEMLHQ